MQDNMKDWIILEFGESERAVEDRGVSWRHIVETSLVMPRRSTELNMTIYKANDQTATQKWRKNY